MTVQEVARDVMKLTGTTQQEIAERNGLAGQSSVGTFLRSKSMRVDNLLMILNTCGYELIARSADGKHPDFVIGEKLSANVDEREESNDDKLAAMVKDAVEKAVADAISSQRYRTLGPDI